MRTTITLPDPLFERAKSLTGDTSFSEFVRQAVADRVEKTQRDHLASEMADGYRAEASEPTLDPAWNDIETEDW